MTVKKRLFISNLIMLLVPIFATLLIGLGCMGAVWYAAQSATHTFSSDEEFYEEVYEVNSPLAATFQHALSLPVDDRAAQLEQLGSELVRDNMAVTILQDEAPCYATGADDPDNDPLLIQAAEVLRGEGVLFQDDRALFAHRFEQEGSTYQIYLFTTSGSAGSSNVRLAVVLAGLVLAFTIFMSVLLTNRFLTRFVLQKIEQPLDLLVYGVHQLRDGNLSYRLNYTGSDEFSPVCADFNSMANRLQDMVQQTQRQETNRNAMMAGLSHDLRSPLTSILAYVEGLLDGVAQTPEARQSYLETIHTKALELQHMVSQIFLFSKMELPEYPVHPELLRLDTAVDDLLKETRTDYAARGLFATASLCPATVLADPAELHRVLTNLLDNSAKYKTRPECHVQIDLTRAERNWLLTLTDDGPGVPPETLDSLFELFYRGDPARREPRQGSGLGLAIVASSIRRMGGSIRAENVPGGGLRMVIALPAKEETHE